MADVAAAFGEERGVGDCDADAGAETGAGELGGEGGEGVGLGVSCEGGHCGSSDTDEMEIRGSGWDANLKNEDGFMKG